MSSGSRPAETVPDERASSPRRLNRAVAVAMPSAAARGGARDERETLHRSDRLLLLLISYSC